MVRLYFNQKSLVKAQTTDTKRELLFRKSQTFGLGQTNWAKTWGAFWVFSAHLSALILALCFPLINHYLYKKNYAFISKFQKIICEWELNLGQKELGI